tara:strand:- start:423 stop:680 length:258 start_codon:yes stop_codon:yes gene_type:complete
MRASTAIRNYGETMYHLAHTEAALHHLAEGHAMRKQRQADVERAKVHVAEAKADLLKATSGKPIVEWEPDEIERFLSPKILEEEE